VPGFVDYKKGCTRLAATSDKVYHLLTHGRWFSPGTPTSSTTKTGRHDIAEILLKVALSTINVNLYPDKHDVYSFCTISKKVCHCCCLSLTFQIKIFYSETNEPTQTNLGGDGRRVLSFQVCICQHCLHPRWPVLPNIEISLIFRY